MEQVLSECSGARVLVKSGPAKPKLEGLSKAQWSLAKLAIFNKLVTEGELDEQGMLDYMSHTAYMYRLMLSKDKASFCRILTPLNQCGSHPQIPGRSLTGMTASLSYCGDVRTQSSVVRPLVFFPHLKRDTQRLRTCRSSLSPSP